MKRPKLLKGVKIREDLEGFLLVYPRHHMYLVNGAGYEILLKCDGDNTIEDISNHILDKYHIDEKRAKEDVTHFLKKFEYILKYEE